MQIMLQNKITPLRRRHAKTVTNLPIAATAHAKPCSMSPTRVPVIRLGLRLGVKYAHATQP